MRHSIAMVLHRPVFKCNPRTSDCFVDITLSGYWGWPESVFRGGIDAVVALLSGAPLIRDGLSRVSIFLKPISDE